MRRTVAVLLLLVGLFAVGSAVIVNHVNPRTTADGEPPPPPPKPTPPCCTVA